MTTETASASTLKRANQPWTPAEIDLLRAKYTNHVTPELVLLFGRTAAAINQRARKLGIRKLESVRKRTLFRAGQTPWNKGTKGVMGHHPNSRANWFKPGRPPQLARNYRPIGSTRIHSGVLQRKVTDDARIVPNLRWKPVHRLVWEQRHGPVPPGHIVRFRNGMQTNVESLITLDRLECVTRAEHLRRNSPLFDNPELRSLYMLRGKITSELKRMADHE